MQSNISSLKWKLQFNKAKWNVHFLTIFWSQNLNFGKKLFNFGSLYLSVSSQNTFSFCDLFLTYTMTSKRLGNFHMVPVSLHHENWGKEKAENSDIPNNAIQLTVIYCILVFPLHNCILFQKLLQNQWIGFGNIIHYSWSLQTCSPQLTVIWSSFAEYILATIKEKSSSYEFLKSCSQF